LIGLADALEGGDARDKAKGAKAGAQRAVHVGLFGWLFRRWLAGVIYGPLLVFWYLVIVVWSTNSAHSRGEEPVIGTGTTILAVVLALISDFIIVRRVKRRMKARPPRPSA
jgi:hypothetical protein